MLPRCAQSRRAGVVDPIIAATAAQSAHLSMPSPNKDGRIVTLNEMGSMNTALDDIDEKFIKIASQPKAKVLEIGAAYGAICVESLKRGSSDYTVVELDGRHLSILAEEVNHTAPSKLPALTLIAGAFPEADIVHCLQENSYDAILASNVMHFMKRDEVLGAFHQFRRLLKPGGKVFIKVRTPYLGFLKEDFLGRYEEQIEQFRSLCSKKATVEEKDAALPGYLEKVREYVDPEKMPEEQVEKNAITRNHAFLFNEESLKYLLAREDFLVDFSAYRSPSYEAWKLDGRERMVVIAQKLI